MILRSNRTKSILTASWRSCYTASLCILLSFMPFSKAQDTGNLPAFLQAQSIVGFVDTQMCKTALTDSDIDDDEKLSPDEYVLFVQAYGPPGFVSDVTDFDNLPVPLVANFLYLSCLCRDLDGADDNCCEGANAHISLQGLAPGDTPTDQETAYLFTVCLLTGQNIERVLASSAPTISPSTSPTLIVPTPAPVTDEPTTLAPTKTGAPTSTPVPTTLEPTITGAPSAAPTKTEAPTSTPVPTTLKPTITGAPSAAPTTLAPTKTGAPTSTPVPTTLKPTITGAPSAAPTTLAPTKTGAPTSTPAPTLKPTITRAPSAAPTTLAPTITGAPTTTPVPTLEPTITRAPSIAPVTPDPTTKAPIPVVPTLAPSFSPSDLPTLSPTMEPTDVPSSSPSSAPSTPEPSNSPTITPVPTVSAAPSVVPTPIPIATVPTSYDIVLTNGNNPAGSVPENAYRDDLIEAMDIVAVQVLKDTDLSGRLRVRRLQASVRTPTSIDDIENENCPSFVSANDACRSVDASVVVELGGESEEAVERKYGDALEAAIDNGDLQKALQQVNPSSPVRILDSEQPPDDDGGGIGGGAIGGIAAAASVLFIAAIGLLMVGRRQASPEKDENDHFPATPVATPPSPTEAKDDTNLGASKPDYGENKKQPVVNLDGMEDEDSPIPGEMGAVSHDSSSNAGSSGWSSSAGISSLNTGSVDDSLDFKSGQGAKLAAIGAASAIAGGAAVAAATKDKKDEEEGEDKPRDSAVNTTDLPEVSNATREDLDNAIESGNWAAVGATAALLAAASDSQSFSSHSRASRNSASRGGSSVSSVDAARAAELDHLVDAGDWEGVVLAAAKFEASSASDSASKGSGEASASASGASATRSGTGSASSAYSQSNYSSTESPAKAQKRAETRAEVEELVRRVVPDEIDNVDEMMLQFKGREEELVETLRTMQERSIAQRARVAKQKSAKREARKSRVEGGLPPMPPAPSGGDGGISGAAAAGIAGGVAALGVAAAVGSRDTKDSDSEGPMHELSSESAGDVPIISSEGSTGAESVSGTESAGSGKRRRTALELAIEAGDWEAVGEAAAMMSDTSVTTASSAEINALAAGGSYTSEDTSSKRSKEGVNAERAAELDAMIDSGDWTGVVAAASSYSKSSSGKSGDAAAAAAAATGTAEQSGQDDSPGKESSSSSGNRRTWFGGKKPAEKKAPEKASLKEDSSIGGDSGDKALKEEQEALAQAEIWMQIAEQSKQEGSTEDRGASDAADWAIARSLSALKQAEEKGEPKSDSSKPSKPDDDDKSV